MSSRTRGAVASGLGCVLGVLTSACGPVELATPELSEADTAACRELVSDLPDTLAGHGRVETEPPGAPGAAWGDPPIVLSCGAAEPAGFTATSVCLEANGVDWFVPPEQDHDNGADLTLTTVGYRPRVRLDVPAEERPDGSAAALAELAAPIKEHLRRVQPCL